MTLKDPIIGFAAAAVGIRLIVLALDSQVRFFLGDSASYLSTAFGIWIPPDRSWLYGLGVNAILRLAPWLGAVILVQSLVSATLPAGAAVMLRSMGVRRWLSWAALIMLSADPMLLYYDRSIMTDAPAAAAVWLGIVFTVAGALRGGTWRWSCAAASFWVAICLRVTVLPLVLLALAWALMVRATSGGFADDLEARRRHLIGPICFVAAVGAGLVAYAAVTGYVTHATPALNPKTGYILLGVVAPILAPEDFSGLGVRDPEGLLLETRHQNYKLRNNQIFSEGGLARRLEQELGSWQRASSAGSALARRSVLRDPRGFARLVAATAAEYLTPQAYVDRFEISFGLSRPLPDALVASLRKKVHDGVDADSPARPSLVLAWLRNWVPAMPFVVWAALAAPVLTLVMLRQMPRPTRSVLLLLGACTWTHALFTFALSVELAHRYLLIFLPLLVSTFALQVDWWMGSESRPAMGR